MAPIAWPAPIGDTQDRIPMQRNWCCMVAKLGVAGSGGCPPCGESEDRRISKIRSHPTFRSADVRGLCKRDAQEVVGKYRSDARHRRIVEGDRWRCTRLSDAS